MHPDLRWLELRLPTPLAHLSNTPGRAVTYRLGCPVVFNHRRDEWAAQASSGLEELRQDHMLAVDLNAAHLDCWVLDPSGNPIRAPHTIPLELDGLPASVRDGRLRAAITAIVRLAIAHGCRSVTVEDLDFADVRQAGRETLGRGGGDRQARPWAWRPAAARCDPTPPADGEGRATGQAERRALGREEPGTPGGQRAAAPPYKTRRGERINARGPGGTGPSGATRQSR